MKQSGSYHSQGLSRALAVFRVLAGADRPLTLAQLAQDLDLPKSTLVRLLSVMQDEGFIRRYGDPPTFAIGHVFHEIAQAYRPPTVVEIAAPTMKRLAAAVGFTANLGVLRGRSVLHLHVEEPRRALRFAASGMLDETYCTGLGKMLLTTLPLDQLDEHLPESEPYESFTPQTITTRSQLEAELNRIRAAGVSLDEEERNHGVSCLAVLLPVEDRPVSISVSGPVGELALRDQRRIQPIVRAAADEIASAPGFAAALAGVPD